MVIFQWLKSWYTSLGPHLQFLQRFAVVKTTWCWSIFGGPGGRLKWFDLLKKSSCFDGFLLVWYFKLKKQTWEISGPWWHSENLEARMLIGLIQVCQVCLVKMSTKAMRKKSFRNWPKGFHVWKNNYQQFYTSSQPKIQLPKFKKAKKKKNSNLLATSICHQKSQLDPQPGSRIWHELPSVSWWARVPSPCQASVGLGGARWNTEAPWGLLEIPYWKL